MEVVTRSVHTIRVRAPFDEATLVRVPRWQDRSNGPLQVSARSMVRFDVPRRPQGRSGAHVRADPRSLAEQVFAGAGEMAGLIRATDWSESALGPIEAWPQSLRTAVSICLGSRHPIVLWWGPQRWMFYNDGYRPFLGERKHPQFLGRPGQECWDEIWSIIGPMMNQVIETGEATWSEDFFLLLLRSGYLEETYYTFSYSPILDDEGRPSGIFNACTETTGRVLADRRMRMLRQMAVEARTVNEAATLCAEILASNPKDVPFALVYLLDEPGKFLLLVAHAGLKPGTPASPLTVDIREPDGTAWPLARVATQGASVIVDDLTRRFDDLPKEPWGESSHQAMLLPIARAGGHRPAGVLVLGISPRRAFDDDYRGFFDLVASHVATAVSNARAYEEERGRAEKLAALDRAKTAFFANVSHEFRTPLTLILGPLEDALGDPTKSLQGESLESAHRNALRLMRLVNSLLDFSRLEAGRLPSSFEATDLPVLTAGLAGSFQSLLESAGLKLVVDCPPLVEPVYIDRAHWEKIVLNLVSNAFKFTFDGEIAVRLHRRRDQVELAVSDTGTGIPEPELPKVFERFHRVEGSRSRTFEGTGIGLALVSELVKAHGGTVRVESVVGRGSTFVVAIPLGSDHLPKERIVPPEDSAIDRSDLNPIALEARQWLRSSTATRAVELGDATRGMAAGSGHRILVADDNADMRQYLLRLLEPHWDVDLVIDGQAALDSALARPPDLVLSDVMMPGLDGVALLRALRADPKTRAVPVVLLSARAGEEAVLEGLDTGADDYLVKPFSARELLTRVRTHLAMARVRQAAADAARELAETRAVLLEDVARKNRELESFSYSVSHDLRAPLRSIDGFAQALIEDHATELTPQGQDYLRRVRAAAQRMGQLIDDLLNLSRVERAELVRQRVDLSRIAGRVAGRLKKNEHERGEFRIQAGVYSMADPRLMEIVLENLLGNAWKFTRKKMSPTIEFGAVERNTGMVFFVKDNGAGFDPAYVAKMFTPFQRLHSEKEFPGTGIGLATVRRIVERHGGRIWAEAIVGEGAAFYWTISPEPWKPA
jgi:signal transduction histidine kinase